MDFPSFERNGFFEGVYDHDFQTSRGIPLELMERHIPTLSRMDIRYARPVIFDFHEGVKEHLTRLGFPYRQTNQLMQIGLQYTHDYENRTPVPDGYIVNYSRLGRVAGADIEKSVRVSVLRSELAEELLDLNAENANDTVQSWQQAARKGRKFGNAVLAYQTARHTYTSLIGRTTTGTAEPMKPADEKLAEAVFETVAFWNS